MSKEVCLMCREVFNTYDDFDKHRNSCVAKHFPLASQLSRREMIAMNTLGSLLTNRSQNNDNENIINLSIKITDKFIEKLDSENNN